MCRCFWLSNWVPNERLNWAHIIVDIREEETEAGTEGDVYIAACGLERNGWSNLSAGDPATITGTMDQAKHQGVEICPGCLAAQKERG